jgi:hypothetical protein
MKNKRAHFRASSQKLNFTKHLVAFWRDLEDNQRNRGAAINSIYGDGASR